ncbi:NADPH-dependent FMN reductase [Polaribacter uvawellassae]|uniref:NADPH-dependent FMN reductase n=1 Tax=Polaribacter uvawellassae TaxID=3133495 RepID=UPI003218E6C6
MKKILAFAGSTSSTSINKKLVTYAAENLKNTTYDLIDLRDFELPIFSEDKQKEDGFPKDVIRFTNLLDNYDGFVLSLAEHNGSYAAAFKNIFDWSSRIKNNVFREKPLLLMAASPGGRGGKSVLEAAVSRFPRNGAGEIVTFSLPNFSDNFKNGELVKEDFKKQLFDAIQEFEKLI